MREAGVRRCTCELLHNIINVPSANDRCHFVLWDRSNKLWTNHKIKARV